MSQADVGAAGRPPPLVLVVEPDPRGADGSYAAIAGRGQALLAAELSRRFAAVGADVARLPAGADSPTFHWGAWFTSAARAARLGARTAGKPGEAIGYAGAGALALLDDRGLSALASARPGEVVANNRFSADAFVVAGDVDGALHALADCASDNAAVRCLEAAGFVSRDLSGGALVALRRRHPARPGAAAAGYAAARDAGAGRRGDRLPGDGGRAERWSAGGAASRRRRRRHPRPGRGARGGGTGAVQRMGLPGDRVRLPGALLHRGARHALGPRSRAAFATGDLDRASWRRRPGGPAWPRWATR